VHGRYEGWVGAVGAVLIEKDRYHDGIVGVVVRIPQKAALPSQSLGLGRTIRVGIVVQNQRHQKGSAQVLFVRPGNGLPEEGKLGVDLLADIAQLGGQALQCQRFEHIADDVVLNGLFGVFKIVVAAEKGDIGGRTNFPHLPCQLDAGDKGHADIRKQEIGLVFFHQLEGVQTVAGVSYQAKPVVLPGNHGAYGFPKFILVVGDDHSVECGHFHRSFLLWEMEKSAAPLLRHSQGNLPAGIFSLFGCRSRLGACSTYLFC
jgi:hypothetical protein